jgi:hypothetical protein
LWETQVVGMRFVGWTDARSIDLCTSRKTLERYLTSTTITVQGICIPQAILGTDVICQAKSGLGKTAVFVLASLQQIEPIQGETSVLVMCHTRELAYQIRAEYQRFGKYMPNVKTGVFYGGTPIQKDIELLNGKDHPHIIVATPGRLNALVRDKKLKLGSIRQFILDECDKMLDQLGKINNTYIPSNSFLPLSRHAPRCSGDLPIYSYPKAGHDVQCHLGSRHPTNLQEIHAVAFGNLR